MSSYSMPCHFDGPVGVIYTGRRPSDGVGLTYHSTLSLWPLACSAWAVSRSVCAVERRLKIQSVPKKWPNLFLSELRQIFTKFDSCWRTYS